MNKLIQVNIDESVTMLHANVLISLPEDKDS